MFLIVIVLCISHHQISVHMHIFSYLDVWSLVRAALVCHQWNNLASDEILWESKLKKDVERWEVVGHLSHPSLYKETMADLTAKQMYVTITFNESAKFMASEKES